MSLGSFLLAAVVVRLSRARVMTRTGLTSGAISHHLHGDRVPGPRARAEYARLGIDASAWDRLA